MMRRMSTMFSRHQDEHSLRAFFELSSIRPAGRHWRMALYLAPYWGMAHRVLAGFPGSPLLYKNTQASLGLQKTCLNRLKNTNALYSIPAFSMLHCSFGIGYWLTNGWSSFGFFFGHQISPGINGWQWMRWVSKFKSDWVGASVFSPSVCQTKFIGRAFAKVASVLSQTHQVEMYQGPLQHRALEGGGSFKNRPSDLYYQHKSKHVLGFCPPISLWDALSIQRTRWLDPSYGTLCRRFWSIVWSDCHCCWEASRLQDLRCEHSTGCEMLCWKVSETWWAKSKQILRVRHDYKLQVICHPCGKSSSHDGLQ